MLIPPFYPTPSPRDEFPPISAHLCATAVSAVLFPRPHALTESARVGLHLSPPQFGGGLGWGRVPSLFARLRLFVIDPWALGFPWTLVIGIWSFFNQKTLDRPKHIPY